MASRIVLAGLLFSAAHAPAQGLRGVNLAGAEFGQSQLPGIMERDYHYNTEATFRYFGAKGMSLLRLPVRWERLQPALRGPLDLPNLLALKQNVEDARRNGSQVIIEPHNFGRYSIDGQEFVIGNAYSGTVRVPPADFADFWARISREFQGNPGVYGYGLVNEPHDMGTADWKAITQAAVVAIRAGGDLAPIIVPGLNWSNSSVWASVNGPVDWITDPANNIIYEAHIYFDRDFSGGYAQSYQQELAANPNLPSIGRERLAPFVDWCRRNNVRGMLGEFGVPDTDPRWFDVLDGFLSALDDSGFDGLYWAAGEWWGNYALSVQPSNNFTQDRPQMPTLLKHIRSDSFRTVAATGAVGFALAPGSLASGFGTALEGADEVTVTGSDGQAMAASILFAGPARVNYRLPDVRSSGPALVSVRRLGAEIAAGKIVVEALAPSLFAASGNGRGVAAAQVLRVSADGTQTYEPVFGQDASGAIVPLPVRFGADRLFLVLYGTGFAGVVGAGQVGLRVGAAALSPSYAGPVADTPGLDQAVVELPNSLAGSGDALIAMRVAGKAANLVMMRFGGE